MNKKVLGIVVAVSLIILIVLIVMVSLFLKSPKKEVIKKLDGGDISLTYTDDTNGLSISDLKPISDATNTDIRADGHPNTKPIKNISLISPPPIDSFLNIKSPISLILAIIPAAAKPCKICNIVSPNPSTSNISITSNTKAGISTSSRINK